MAETARMRNLLKVASRAGARLFRQNVGLAWTGEVVERSANRMVLKNPRPLHAGLIKGSSDLIGWTPCRITPDMVGKTVAIFTAVEVKEPKKGATDEQVIFLENVQKAGGYAGIAVEPDDVHNILRVAAAAGSTC